MQNSIPEWPAKMTRDEQKLVRKHRKEFEAALKQRAKGSGWRFAGNTIFRQEDGWMLAATPRPTWQRGVKNRLLVKPMALDPIFWEIVGLEENNNTPLSFRIYGAWILSPPSIVEFKNARMVDPVKLADAAFAWTEKWRLQNLSSYSVDKLLAQLGPLEKTSGHYRSVSICLLILQGDFQRARTLCDADPSDAGGFWSVGSGSFYTQAKRWLAENKR